MKRRSLRFQLAVSTSLGSLVTLGVLGALIYISIHRSLYRAFDDSLKIEAQRIADLVELDGDTIRFEYDPAQLPEFRTSHVRMFFSVRDANGRILATSPGVNVDEPSLTTRSSRRSTSQTLPDGMVVRVVSIQGVPHREAEAPRTQISGGAPPPVKIVVAGEAGSVERALSGVRWLILIYAAASIVGVGVVMARIVRRELTPVNALASDIAALSEGGLGERVRTERLPLEILPIAERLNQLLDTVERAFDRERVFTSDASHELRTPLAGLRASLEVSRSRPRSQAEYEATLDQCLEVTGHLEAMTKSLLSLARADARVPNMSATPCDLSAIAEGVMDKMFDRITSRGLTVFKDLPKAPLASDPQALTMIVSNLLENAVEHVDEGGTVRVSVLSEVDFRRLIISNSGSEVSSEDAPRVFQRYWRADAARKTSGHVGIGLSLVQRFAEMLHGTVDIETSMGEDFTVTLTLPIHFAADQSAHKVIGAARDVSDGRE